MDAVAMTLEWARPDLDPVFVHLWRYGQEPVMYKHPSYEGRTSLFIDKLKYGDISLKLSKVKLSDEGKYRCFLPSLGRESIVQLVVGAAFSPVVEITKDSSGVVLGCESKGWYPEPEVFWLDGEGNILSAGPTETVRGPDGLYTVSSRVTVEKTDTNRFTYDFFLSSSAVYISIVLAVVFMCIVAVVFVVWRWRRNKLSLSQVVDQSQPIVAIVGDDIILPCHLEPAMDAVAMALEWARPDLEPRFVHVWRDGQDLLINKHPSYEGRTRLFINKLKHGDISLKLSEVKLSDEGKYRCFIPSLGRESIVKLVVGAVSSPVIGITKASSEVVLGCESKGWYPEPEVFWLDGEGNILSAGPTETVRGPDGLYTVSSRVTVEKTDTFTCRVQQQSINQSRERQIHIPIPDVPFPAAVHINIVLAVVFMCIVAVFVVWRWRRNKISK
ncbi:butyrophilin-like protein 2 [Centroberyx gerrardi]